MDQHFSLKLLKHKQRCNNQYFRVFDILFNRYIIRIILVFFVYTSLNGQIIKQLGGGNNFPKNQASAEFNAGFSFHSVVWPQLPQYPGSEFQMGLPHTWMSPQVGYQGYYTTIEGGLGWWSDTRFATITPKFIMGGVAWGFSHFSNGPNAGQGTCADQRGKFGTAQISNRLLWPPDGLNIKQGTIGELFGYGYIPLPIMEPRSIEQGFPQPSGNNSWTLFLNANNFKGPVSFFLPLLWTSLGPDKSQWVGKGFDVQGNSPYFSLSMEVSYIPSIISLDSATGQYYAKTPILQFPLNLGKNSLLVHGFHSYNKSALPDSVHQWFAGGAVPSGKLNIKGSSNTPFNDGGSLNLHMYNPLWKGETKWPESDVDLSSLVKGKIFDPMSNGYEWLSSVDTSKKFFNLPQYYLLKVGTPNKWVPVEERLVPKKTGLLDYVFKSGRDQNPTPYTQPFQKDPEWTKPGPKAGPFYAYLGDGSKLTYYWYRFADQPAMYCYGLKDQEKSLMQERIEKFHKNWTPDKMYLPQPTTSIKVADLDPGLIVTPPAGLEVGYVPLVVKQELNKDPISVVQTSKSTQKFQQRNREIQIYNPGTGDLSLYFHTLNGKMQWVQKMSLSNKGNHTLVVTREKVPKGVYLITIVANSRGLFEGLVYFKD